MFSLQCKQCNSKNYIAADAEDVFHAWKCWNCASVWMFEIYSIKPILIVDGESSRRE